MNSLLQKKFGFKIYYSCKRWKTNVYVKLSVVFWREYTSVRKKNNVSKLLNVISWSLCVSCVTAEGRVDSSHRAPSHEQRTKYYHAPNNRLNRVPAYQHHCTGQWSKCMKYSVPVYASTVAPHGEYVCNH